MIKENLVNGTFSMNEKYDIILMNGIDKNDKSLLNDKFNEFMQQVDKTKVIAYIDIIKDSFVNETTLTNAKCFSEIKKINEKIVMFEDNINELQNMVKLFVIENNIKMIQNMKKDAELTKKKIETEINNNLDLIIDKFSTPFENENKTMVKYLLINVKRFA